MTMKANKTSGVCLCLCLCFCCLCFCEMSRKVNRVNTNSLRKSSFTEKKFSQDQGVQRKRPDWLQIWIWPSHSGGKDSLPYQHECLRGGFISACWADSFISCWWLKLCPCSSLTKGASLDRLKLFFSFSGIGWGQAFAWCSWLLFHRRRWCQVQTLLRVCFYIQNFFVSQKKASNSLLFPHAIHQVVNYR